MKRVAIAGAKQLPVLIHCESGREALLEGSRDFPVITYWERWQDIWVPTDSPLLRR